jgi:hypothetical protein
MASRITIYGKPGDKNTERLRREMRVMSLEYNFQDIAKNPAVLQRLSDMGEDMTVLPKIEVALNRDSGSVFLSNPDAATLRRTLYSEDVFGITSYWI